MLLTKIHEMNNDIAYSAISYDSTYTMCMFDESHLTFNFKSKVSCDVFKNIN